MSRADCDVVVIGAGLAGLYAAWLLEARGYRVRVLEASERTGGRIHSMRQLGSGTEAGATYIGAGYARTIALAEHFDVPLVDVTPILEFFREQDLVLGREIIAQAEWPEHAANPFRGDERELMPWNYHRVVTMRDNPLGSPAAWIEPRHAALDVPFRDWLISRGLDEGAVPMAYGINTSYGRDASDVSALFMLFRGAFSKAQRRLAPRGSLGYTVAGGVARIPEAVAASLAREVELSRTVVGLATTDDGVTVATADGAMLGARRAVCSIPLGLLAGLRFDPELPADQRAAVGSLGAQALTQVYLGAAAPFWDEDGHAPSMFTDSAAGMVAAVRSGDDPRKVTHLTAWLMGATAERLDRAGPAETGREVVAAIEAIRPAARGRLEVLGVQSWGANPHARGAWAYFKPGQVTRCAAAMGAAHGRIHFCGEHLAVADRGMEAALETAERAVHEIETAES